MYYTHNGCMTRTLPLLLPFSGNRVMPEPEPKAKTAKVTTLTSALARGTKKIVTEDWWLKASTKREGERTQM